MITEFFIDTFFDITRFLVTLLPNPDTLPSGIADAFTAIEPYWGTAARFFPLTVVFAIFAFGTALELGILSFKMGNWVWDKWRGAG